MSSVEVRKRKTRAAPDDKNEFMNTLYNISSSGADKDSVNSNIRSITSFSKIAPFTWMALRMMIIMAMILLMMNYDLSFFHMDHNDQRNKPTILLVKDDDIVPTILKDLNNRKLMTGIHPFHFHFHPSSSALSYYPKFDIQDILSSFDENIQIDIGTNSIHKVEADKKGNANGDENDIYPIVLDSKLKSKGDKDTNVKENKDKDNSNNNDQMVLTRRGYKGGPVNSQVNQDRAIIIKHPLTLLTNSNKHKKANLEKDSLVMMIGIFDGHGRSGHLVAQFVQVS